MQARYYPMYFSHHQTCRRMRRGVRYVVEMGYALEGDTSNWPCGVSVRQGWKTFSFERFPTWSSAQERYDEILNDFDTFLMEEIL